MRVAGVGKFETRIRWRVRVTGDFNLAGVGVFLSPPPDFPPAAIPSQSPTDLRVLIKHQALSSSVRGLNEG
jgi:hypothetical protein